MKEYLQDLFWLILVAAAVLVAVLYANPANADARWQAHAAAMEAEYSLPPGIVRAICAQESNWRNVAGRHGEIGVCQLKPSTIVMVCPSCAENAAGVFFSHGSRGPAVAGIQARLARLGLYQGPVDGLFGAQTHRAVLAFQAGAGVAVDGVVGPRTWAKLFPGDPYPGGSIVAALWEPYQNIAWAAKYLAWLRDNVSDDPAVMIAAYNGGPGNTVALYLKKVAERMRLLTTQRALPYSG